MASVDGRTTGMTPDERKLLFQTATALGAILEALGDGEGLHTIDQIRMRFRQQAADLIVAMHQESLKREGSLK